VHWEPVGALANSGLDHSSFIGSPFAALRLRDRAALEKAAIPFKILDESVNVTSNYVSVSTMHLAKVHLPPPA
jgi:hypothetical protein